MAFPRSALTALAGLAMLATAPAFAQDDFTEKATTPAPIPAEVQAMFDSALAEGKLADAETLARYIGRAYPADAARIEARLAEEKIKQPVENAPIVAVAIAPVAPPSQPSPPPKPPSAWDGKGELGGFLATGTSDSVGLSAGLTLSRKTDDTQLIARAQGDYQRTDGVTAREYLIAALEPRWDINPRVYTFGLAQFDHDPQQGYDRRYAVSGGLGLRVIDSDALRFSVKGGPAYRWTNLVTGEHEQMISALASAEMLWKMAEGVKLSGNGNLFVDQDRQSFAATTALDTRISGELSARLSWSVKREQSQMLAIDTTDTISRASIVYDF